MWTYLTDNWFVNLIGSVPGAAIALYVIFIVGIYFTLIDMADKMKHYQKILDDADRSARPRLHYHWLAIGAYSAAMVYTMFARFYGMA